MALTPETVDAAIGRAASDPDFLTRLLQDPAGTASAEGWNLSPVELKELLDQLGASDGVRQNLDGLVEQLEARVSHAAWKQKG